MAYRGILSIRSIPLTSWYQIEEEVDQWGQNNVFLTIGTSCRCDHIIWSADTAKLTSLFLID